MGGLLAGFRLQLWFYRSQPDMWIPLITAPLYTVIFSMILRHSGRNDIAGYAVVAPFFMALWWFALFHGGSIIQRDRSEGTLEPQAATPVGLPMVLLGRIAAIMLVGLVSFVEVWLFGALVLDLDVTIYHPGVLAGTMIVTIFAMASTALLFSGLFVLSRSAATYTNSASYPFYVLGGIIVPVALLPGWVQPLSRMVFLSWAANLLRASFTAEPVPHLAESFGAVVALGLGTLASSVMMIRWVLRQVRATGEMDYQ